jgi:hypothetical protein
VKCNGFVVCFTTVFLVPSRFCALAPATLNSAEARDFCCT